MTAAWIQTFTGRRFDVLEPTLDSIHLADIAHSLSMQCRFTGHTTAYFSVGEHSIVAAVMALELGFDAEVQLACLLHDASEAYLTDLSRPVKRHSPVGAAYRPIEAKIQRLINTKYGLEPDAHDDPRVVEIDARMLATEYRQLMQQDAPGCVWSEMPEPFPQTLFCTGPRDTKNAFFTALKCISIGLKNRDAARLINSEAQDVR